MFEHLESDLPEQVELPASVAQTVHVPLEGCVDQFCNCLQCAAHRSVDALAALAHSFAEQSARQEVMEAQVGG